MLADAPMHHSPRQGCFSKTSGEVDGNTSAKDEMGLALGNDNRPEWGVAESRSNRSIEWLQFHPPSRTVRRTIPTASNVQGCREVTCADLDI